MVAATQCHDHGVDGKDDDEIEDDDVQEKR